MHRGDDGTLVLTAADLVDSLECRHLTQLDRRAAHGLLVRPTRDDPDLEPARRRRAARQQAELHRLLDAGRHVVEVEPGPGGDVDLRAAAATEAAMRVGAEVVRHAAFADGRWRADADFLHRVPMPSRLGEWGYEAVATTSARRATPVTLLRLAAASELLRRVQGVAPHDVVVVTADGGHHRVPLADVAAAHREARRGLEEAVAAPLDGPGAPSTYPDPVPHCRSCRWAAHCDARRRADDHLSLIAGAHHETAAHLVAAGITTGAQLAASAEGESVAGLEPAVVDRLRRQARLQLRQRADGVVRYELLPQEPRPDGPPGLAGLPAPSAADLFFDIEGDPWVGDGGLEYLFGLVDQPGGPSGGPRYRAFWGHDAAGERAAFEQVVDVVAAALTADPAMHVYHFAAYEVTALRKLAARHATRQHEVDRLVRAGVFVDLYRVVRDAVVVSQEGYGLKKLEPLYLDARTGPITDGGSSVTAYERWRAVGDPRVLDDIRAYNEVDCRSTLALRDWLEGRRRELEARSGSPLPRPARVVEPPADGPVAAAGDGGTPVAAAADERAALAPVHPRPHPHPAIARFLEGATGPDAPVADAAPAGPRVADGPLVAGGGPRLALVPASGADAEAAVAAAVATLHRALVGRRWTDAAGCDRPLAVGDVVVVAPAAGVARLADALPAGATVEAPERFPAGGAPVVLAAVASRPGGGLPWGVEAVLGRSALEVVLSGAGALAVVVASRDLLRARCRTVEQLAFVNALCRLAEEVPRVDVPAG